MAQMAMDLRSLAEIDRLAAGNLVEWFARLYTLYYPRIDRYLYSLLRDHEQAEDAAQDTFVKAWQALPMKDATLRVSPWLYRIATNTAYDALRRRRLITWQSLEGLEELTTDEACHDPLEVVCGLEATRLLQQAFDQLPLPDQVTLVHWRREGSARAMAVALGMKEGVARGRLTRARKAWRQAYDALRGPEAG